MANQSTCQDCKYFRRHFLKDERGYHDMSVGHCQYPRIKRKFELDTACNFFEPLKKECVK